jgi:hypothetical protein
VGVTHALRRWRPCPARDISRAVFASSRSRSASVIAPPLAAFTIALLAAFTPASARADITSWFSLGGGIAALAQPQDPNHYPAVLQGEAGLGSPPRGAVIVGGVAKTLTYFGQGTDLAIALRGATGGFVRGGFGFAIDAGAYHRGWGRGSDGFLGALVLGAPLGFQLTGLVELGSNDVQTYGAVLGIDFLRLTVYRATSGSYWPNPMVPRPADGR